LENDELKSQKMEAVKFIDQANCGSTLMISHALLSLEFFRERNNDKVFKEQTTVAKYLRMSYQFSLFDLYD